MNPYIINAFVEKAEHFFLSSKPGVLFPRSQPQTQTLCTRQTTKDAFWRKSGKARSSTPTKITRRTRTCWRKYGTLSALSHLSRSLPHLSTHSVSLTHFLHPHILAWLTFFPFSLIQPFSATLLELSITILLPAFLLQTFFCFGSTKPWTAANNKTMDMPFSTAERLFLLSSADAATAADMAGTMNMLVGSSSSSSTHFFSHLVFE